MSKTTIKDLSKGNDYRLPRHRSYELRHFCWQYPAWKKAYISLDGASKLPSDMEFLPRRYEHGNPTERVAMARAFLSERIEMVENTAKEADPELASYILKGVGYGYSYEELRAKFGLPCCKKVYYDRVRRFFWLLDEVRG